MKGSRCSSLAFGQGSSHLVRVLRTVVRGGASGGGSGRSAAARSSPNARQKNPAATSGDQDADAGEAGVSTFPTAWLASWYFWCSATAATGPGPGSVAPAGTTVPFAATSVGWPGTTPGAGVRHGHRAVDGSRWWRRRPTDASAPPSGRGGRGRGSRRRARRRRRGGRRRARRGRGAGLRRRARGRRRLRRRRACVDWPCSSSRRPASCPTTRSWSSRLRRRALRRGRGSRRRVWFVVAGLLLPEPASSSAPAERRGGRGWLVAAGVAVGVGLLLASTQVS